MSSPACGLSSFFKCLSRSLPHTDHFARMNLERFTCNQLIALGCGGEEGVMSPPMTSPRTYLIGSVASYNSNT